MKMAVLASGSKGNATLVSCGATNILVDAGIPAKGIETALAGFGLALNDISAVIVTHSHTDHFRGLEALSRKIRAPLFASEETASSIDICLEKTKKRRNSPLEWNYISSGSAFTFNNLLITPFEVPHDANGATAYTIEDGQCKIGIATDLGCATNSVEYHLDGCDALVLEMNHDIGMLRKSNRPEILKIRIAGKLGHLSNDQAVEFLEALDTSRLKYLFPAHISEECNDFSCIAAALLNMRGGRGFEIIRTSQNTPTAMVEVSVNNL